MEDYKKKYEQARERARDMLYYKEVRQEDIEYIFPELKENDDEKIRKEIIRIVDGYFPDKASTQREKCIAWLEKQGEQKPNPALDIEIPFGAKDSELQEASYHIPEGFHVEIYGNRVVIKRGKQKPIDKVKPKFKIEEGKVVCMHSDLCFKR